MVSRAEELAKNVTEKYPFAYTRLFIARVRNKNTTNIRMELNYTRI